MKLPRDVSGRDVIRALERLGFSDARQTGSHVRLIRGDRRVTVPDRDSVAPGTLKSILRQAGVEAEIFAKNL